MAHRTYATATAPAIPYVEPALYMLSLIWKMIMLALAFSRQTLSQMSRLTIPRMHIQLVVECKLEFGHPSPQNDPQCHHPGPVTEVTASLQPEEDSTDYTSNEWLENATEANDNAEAGPAAPLHGSLFGILGN